VDKAENVAVSWCALFPAQELGLAKLGYTWDGTHLGGKGEEKNLVSAFPEVI
jgi:hypothetical protein